MWYFATFEVDGEERIRKFAGVEGLFEWLQEWHNDVAPGLPPKLCVWQADCVLDYS